MGYEHKLIIAKRTEITSPINKVIVCGEQIATYKCSRMPQSFYDLFHYHGTPIDFDLYTNNDEPTRTDPYGEHCKMLDLQTVIDHLHDIQTNNSEWSDYRRIPPIIGLLEGFNAEQWTANAPTFKESLVIVHYGY